MRGTWGIMEIDRRSVGSSRGGQPASARNNLRMWHLELIGFGLVWGSLLVEPCQMRDVSVKADALSIRPSI